MDVFAVHERVIADYRAFTSGFVDVRDERIKKVVAEQFAEGVQWPDPWLSLNPSFASGGSVTDSSEAASCTRSASASSSARTTLSSSRARPWSSAPAPA